MVGGHYFYMKKTKTKKIIYEWFSWAQSYLRLAEIGLLELINQKYRNKRSPDTQLNQIYKSKHLLIPIFFNIKHSIEVFLKALNINITGKYYKEHNIDTLLKDLKESINKFPDSEHKKRALQILEQRNDLLKKYTNCEILGKGRVKDFNNIVFRYLENDFIEFDVLKEVGKIDDSRIIEIQQDINTLHNLFFILDMRVTLGRKDNKEDEK